VQKRIVITGLGVVSPIGVGRDAFWSSLVNGKSGIKDISVFDTSKMSSKKGGEITDFDPVEILDGINIAALDRTAQLVCSAVKLGIDDAGLDWSGTQKSKTGLLFGSSFGHTHTYSQFDRTHVSKGFLAASAKDFANSVAITNVGHASVMFGLEAFNGLVSMGQSSSLGAINLGTSFIRLDRADMVFVGGVEVLYLENFLQFYLADRLASSRDGQPEMCAPFDRRRNGTILAEGSAVAILEEYEHAAARGAKVYGEILGYGTAFDPQFASRQKTTGKGLAKAMRLALNSANLKPEEIDYICAAGSSSTYEDEVECSAIKEVFESALENVRVSAIKSMIGECFSAAGVMQLCTSAIALNTGTIPPTVNYQDPDPNCGLPLSAEAQQGSFKTAMVNTLDDSGIAASLVIGRTTGDRLVA